MLLNIMVLKFLVGIVTSAGMSHDATNCVANGVLIKFNGWCAQRPAKRIRDDGNAMEHKAQGVGHVAVLLRPDGREADLNEVRPGAARHHVAQRTAMDTNNSSCVVKEFHCF